MEKLYLLIDDYANKWRKSLCKDDFIKEFGPIDEHEQVLHNAQVAENHEFLMDVVRKMNDLLPGEIVAKDSYYHNEKGVLKVKIDFFIKKENSEELIPLQVTEADTKCVEEIIEATEEFVEKDFISIF